MDKFLSFFIILFLILFLVFFSSNNKFIFLHSSLLIPSRPFVFRSIDERTKELLLS